MKSVVVLSILAVGFAASASMPPAARAGGSVPPILPFQARITNAAGATIPPGTTVQFQIFNADQGGTSVWGPETHVVTPVGGVVSVSLGDGVPPVALTQAVFVGERYLQVTVADEVQAPRIRIGPTGFAYTSVFAEVAGLTQSVTDNAITTNKIANDAVTGPKIAQNAVGSPAIAADAVGLSEIATDAVGALEILAGAVGNSELGTDAVTAAKSLDEPGVAFDQDAPQDVVIPQTGVPVTVASVTINTPAPGFVAVSYGGYYFDGSHTLGQFGMLRASVSETGAAVLIDKSLTIAHVGTGLPTGTYWGPTVGKVVIYSKPVAGAYTFHLVCDNQGSEDVNIIFGTIQAIFYPSDYGTSLGGTPVAVVGESPSTHGPGR